jgi:1-aminocyclopropane-1-carboxylate deaminase
MELSNSIEHELNWSLATNNGIRVFVKRDDLIHPIVSGNKWRKLRLIFEVAESEAVKRIVTFGGAYSNHLLATACACNLHGFESIGFVRGEKPEILNHMLGMCSLYGMKLIFVSREEYKNKQSLYEKYYADDKDALFVDEGGRNPLAALGCQDIVYELNGQYDYISVSCGTATTMEGIVGAVGVKKIETKVLGFSALKSNEDDKRRLNNFTADSYEWYDESFFGGYAKCNKVLVDFIREFTSETGLLVDQVYNGKMFYQLAQLINNGRFKKGDKILAVHTGGLHGLLTDRFLKHL